MRLPDLEGALTDLSDTLGPWTYALVAALAFLETGAFVGLVAPGETAIVLGGVVAAEGGVDLAAMIARRLAGRRARRPRELRARPAPRPALPRSRAARASASPRRALERVEAFFDRHGPKAILVGRFIGLVRAVAPFLAGASGMRLRAFLPWSLLGTALWATAFTLVGYAFHESFASAAHTLTHGALALAVVVAGVLASARTGRRGRLGRSSSALRLRRCTARTASSRGRVSRRGWRSRGRRTWHGALAVPECRVV